MPHDLLLSLYHWSNVMWCDVAWINPWKAGQIPHQTTTNELLLHIRIISEQSVTWLEQSTIWYFLSSTPDMVKFAKGLKFCSVWIRYTFKTQETGVKGQSWWPRKTNIDNYKADNFLSFHSTIICSYNTSDWLFRLCSGLLKTTKSLYKCYTCLKLISQFRIYLTAKIKSPSHCYDPM